MDQLDLWIFSTSAKVRQSIALKTYKESKIPKPSHPLGITRLASTQRAHPGKVSPANRICSPDKGTKQACQARAFHRTVYGYGRNWRTLIRLRTVHLRPYFETRGPSYGTVRYRIRPYTVIRRIRCNKSE